MVDEGFLGFAGVPNLVSANHCLVQPLAIVLEYTIRPAAVE